VPGLFEQIAKCNVSKENTLVEPPDGKQWLCGLAEGESLLVRQCYAWFYKEARRKMAEKRVPKCPGLIYTGNPGIGKSSWLNYALVRFLQDGYAVVLERAKTSDYWVFRDNTCTFKDKRVRGSVLAGLPVNAVYLFDPDENDSHPLESNVFTIVATSPQEKHYKALKKRGGFRHYFPCWEQEELIACGGGTDEATVRNRFARWGGIPRYVFHQNQQQLEADLLKAITGMDLSLVAKYLRTPEISDDDQRTISHMVVQYRIVDGAFSQCDLDFASPEIGRAVVQAKGASDYLALLQHYESVRRQRWQGAYLGHLWEHLCHKILPLGAKDGFKLEPLGKGKTKGVLKKAVEMKQGDADDMQIVVDDCHYFQPSAPNFPVIDAALKEGKAVYGFQMTVASSHPPKAHGTADLVRRFPSLQLVWVVDGAKQDHINTKQGFEQSKDPAKKVDAATLKKLEKVPQWLLKLQFPKENPFISK
jgi:hypothetical protein